MAIPAILNGTGAPASESGVPSYLAIWNGSQWVPLGTTNALPVSGSITGTVTTTANYSAIAPAGQASTASLVVLAGCEFDARTWISLAYTIAVATNAVTWSVFGANAADYSDEVVVSAGASVAAAAASSYAVALAPYAYYRVKIIDTAAGDHGTATVRGIVKA